MTLPTPSFAFYHRLNSRERVLLLVTAGSLLFILNLVLLSFLLRNSHELNLQYAAKSQELNGELLFAAQKPGLWEPRNNWLHANQPELKNRALAGSQLLETVQGIARGASVIVTNPSIPSPTGSSPSNPSGGNPDFQPVTVRIQTQSDWRNLVKFIAALQTPKSFLMFEQASLRTDRADPNVMRGEFLISKWYAPGGK